MASIPFERSGLGGKQGGIDHVQIEKAQSRFRDCASENTRLYRLELKLEKISYGLASGFGSPGGLSPGGLLPGGLSPGGFPPGGLSPGGLPPGGLSPGGLSPGGFPPGGLSPGGFPPGGLSPGGLSPGGFPPGGLSPGGLPVGGLSPGGLSPGGFPGFPGFSTLGASGLLGFWSGLSWAAMLSCKPAKTAANTPYLRYFIGGAECVIDC